VALSPQQLDSVFRRREASPDESTDRGSEVGPLQEDVVADRRLVGAADDQPSDGPIDGKGFEDSDPSRETGAIASTAPARMIDDGAGLQPERRGDVIGGLHRSAAAWAKPANLPLREHKTQHAGDRERIGSEGDEMGDGGERVPGGCGSQNEARARRPQRDDGALTGADIADRECVRPCS
jgi:hypothetical protein